MKKLALPFLLLAATLLPAQSTQSRVGGRAIASAYSGWSARLVTSVGSGPAVITLDNCIFQVPGRGDIFAIATNTPLYVGGDNSESVTPSAVSKPVVSTGAANGFTCSASVTLSSPHQAGSYISYGDGGVGAAVNDLKSGIVVLDPSWYSTVAITSLPGGRSTVSLSDERTGPEVKYCWGGAAYAVCPSGAISGLSTSKIPKAGSGTSLADSLLDDGLSRANTLTYAGSGGIAMQASNIAGGGFLNIGFPGTNGTSRILHDYVNQDTTGSNVMGHWFDNIVSTTFNSVIDQIRVEGWNVTPGGGKSNSAQTMIADQWESNYWPDGVTCQMERHILLAGSSGSPVRPFTMANNCSDGSTRFMTFSSDTGVGFNYLTGVNAGVQYIGLSPTAGITSTAGMGINSGTFINADNSFTLATTTLGGASPSNRTKQYSSAISGTCPNAGDIAWPGSNTSASPDYYICHVAAGAWIANGTGTLNANFGEYVNAASTGTQPGIDFRQIGNGGIEVYSTYTDVNNNCGMLISPLGSAPQANFYNVGFRRGTCTDITTAIIGGWTGVGASIRGGSTEGISVDTSGNPTLKNTAKTSTLGLVGSSSGVVTVQPQAAAGTYNFNIPTTAGTAGQALTSQGGGSTPMTWSTPASVQLCGTTTTCAKTVQTAPIFVYGTVPLVSGTPSTATLTALPFTSTSSYVCTGSPVGSTAAIAAGGVAFSNASASSTILTGPNTVSTVISYQCKGS